MAERSCSACGLVRRGARGAPCGNLACSGTLGPLLREGEDGELQTHRPGLMALLMTWQRPAWTAPVVVVLGLALARLTRWLWSD